MPSFDDLEQQYGLGWIPDYPDFRDYTPETKPVAELFAKSKGTEMLGTPKANEFVPEGPQTSCDLLPGSLPSMTRMGPIHVQHMRPTAL
jgi:hypothetical protein